MRGAFAKDALRFVWQSRRRFVLMAAICMLGVTMFVGVKAACDNLRLSADAFFDGQSLYDVSVQSTLGLTDDDVAALAEIPGVSRAQGSWTETARTDVAGTSCSVSVMTYEPGGLNEPYLLDGRLPQAADEVAVTQEFLEDAGLGLGDTVTFSADDAETGDDADAATGDDADAETDDDADAEEIDVSAGAETEQFATHAYRIVGTVIDPTSVNAKHGSSSFRATGPSYSFFVTRDAVTSEVYSVVYLEVAGARELSGFSGEYDRLVSDVTDEAESIKAERERVRGDEVRAEATAQVDDAEDEALAELADAQEQLDDAQEQIDDALEQIGEGRAELAEQRAELEDGQAQLDAAAAQLDDAEAALAEAQAQLPGDQVALDAARGQAAEGQEQLDAAQDELDAAREAFEQHQASWPEQRAQLELALEALEGQRPQAAAAVEGLEARIGELEAVEEPTEEQLAELEVLRGQLEEASEALEELDGRIGQTSAALEQGDAALEETPAQLEAGQAELDARREELAAGSAGLDQWQDGLDAVAAGWAEVADGRAEVASMQAQLDAAWPLLEEGAAQLDEAQAEADEGQAELDERREEFEEGKREALERIEDARDEVAGIEDATWYVQDRGAISSYASVDSDAGSIEAIGTVFPVIFLTVAILVSLTTASRMVEEERGLIGLYKALGYGRATIMAKYVLYSLAAALAGGAVGAVLGFVALPSFLATVFRVMYVLPRFYLHFDPALCALSVGMFAAGTCLATWVTCRGELAQQPAALMRPKAPKAGARILLEHIGPLWRRISFLNKVTLRNLFRYKRRFAMTVFGVAGCTALMIVGFAISDSVNALSANQYGDGSRAGVYDYDLMVATTGADDLAELAGDFTADDRVLDYLGFYTDNLTVERDGEKETVQLVVVPEGADLAGYVELRDMGGEALDVGEACAGPDGVAGTDDDGVLLTNNAAELLGVGAGDEVAMSDSALREATARVDGVCVNYLGNAVYMTQAAYERLFDAPMEPNALFAHLAGDADEQVAFGEELSHDPLVRSSTTVETAVRDFEANFMLINYVVVLLVCLAAGLSFVVLFTLATTNISERERELATIKVLGFRRREVRTYVNKETVALTLIGTAAGVPLGWALSHLLTYVLVMPQLYFAVEIHPLSYVWSCAFSILFAVVVNTICNRTLDRVDMVAALKSAE